MEWPCLGGSLFGHGVAILSRGVVKFGRGVAILSPGVAMFGHRVAMFGRGMAILSCWVAMFGRGVGFLVQGYRWPLSLTGICGIGAEYRKMRNIWTLRNNLILRKTGTSGIRGLTEYRS